jgi:hypothetical protein
MVYRKKKRPTSYVNIWGREIKKLSAKINCLNGNEREISKIYAGRRYSKAL